MNQEKEELQERLAGSQLAGRIGADWIRPMEGAGRPQPTRRKRGVRGPRQLEAKRERGGLFVCQERSVYYRFGQLLWTELPEDSFYCHFVQKWQEK